MSFIQRVARLPAPIWQDAYGIAKITIRQRPCCWIGSHVRLYGLTAPNKQLDDKSNTKIEIPTAKSTGPQVDTKLTVKQRYSPENVRKDVKRYVFVRYIDYVKNYNAVLEKNFPSAVKVYRVFVDGFKEFYNDMKRYLKISRIVNESPEGIKALNRKELELYMQMPRDMVKVAPALIGSSLPMVGYAIMPIVFMFPRTFLSSHFWTLQQRAQFSEILLKERLKCYRPALRFLQSKIKEMPSNELSAKMEIILGKIGSGFHPSVDELLVVKEVFTQPPYHILSLSNKHIKVLSSIHGIPGSLFKRFRLREHAFLIHYMDMAIGREGGVHNMPADALRYACYLRGLHPSNISNDEMIQWLRNWIKISMSVQIDHLSLFLHLPIFLAYNHPSNWRLLHGDKPKHKQLKQSLQ